MIFIFGIARSGTNLISRILDLHPEISVVLDPFMPLFRSFRNAALRREGATFNPRSPFFDYYGMVDGQALLQATISADLSIEFEGDIAALRESICARASLEAEDLGSLSSIDGRSYAELFANGLSIIQSVRRKPIIAAKELWTIDFAPALARAFPNAKFIFLERDPRAIIASLLTMAEKDPTQGAHAPSYVRHWRKNVGLAREFVETMPDRSILLNYETVVHQPHEATHQICKMLEVDYLDIMTKTERDGWTSNSSFSDMGGEINTASIERWRSVLSPGTMSAINFMCAPEMRIAGYNDFLWHPGGLADVESFLWYWHCRPGSWRSDGGDLCNALEVERKRADEMR